MWLKEIILAVVATIFLSTPCSSYTIDSRALQTKNYATSANVADSYDFIIVGGGLAGLVIASRLSEDSSTTVLVLEAGQSGDAVQNQINPPAATYYNSLVGTAYDWAYKTVPQPNAGNRAMNWPRGKVLGGSSAINGMYYIRPSEIEVEAWNSLIVPNDNSGASDWHWNNFHNASMKSETFTQPKSDIQATGHINFQLDSFGSSGPVHVTYPAYMPSVVGNWIPSLESIGIQLATDPTGGKNFGGFVAPLSINPTNWTRSYSKPAYIDSLPPRKNLDILTSATVTRIIFGNKTTSGDQIATGVEFASSANDQKKVINVRKEVIVAGGTLGSPHVLMHSGVGPKDVLDGAGVPVVVELPGVGQRLQDHLVTAVAWEAKAETAGDIQKSGSDFSKQPEFMSFVNSAVAYVNTTTLFGANAQDFQASIQKGFADSAASLVPSQYQEVVEGYKTIYNTTANLMPGEIGQIELLLAINSPGSISIQAAIQHPFSHGRVYINASSPFDAIVVDPQYFSHFADVAIMREGIKLARKIGQAPPMRDALGAETAPGPNITTDEELDGWLAGSVQTEFHPTATCAMLPRSQGGVVNAKLQVYGLANVRVADASVFPFSFSAHLESPTYGLAERAADIIKTLYKPPTNLSPDPSGPSTSDSSSPSGKPNSSASSSGKFVFQGAVLFTIFSLTALFLL